MGHRAIGVLTGPIHNTPPINDRFQSAIGRIKAHGLTLPDDWLVITDDCRGVSVKAAAARLFKPDRRPTAVVCTGDILALGIVSEARAHGLRAPEDLSIIGCGDTDMGHYVDPPLTTVRMPFAEMGEVAVAHLLALLDGRAPPQFVVLPASLVVRHSVARR
jgi:LacI family transcriptional regulator